MSDVRSSVPEPDYDHLLRSNLERVFNERDADQRAMAVAELFASDPILYEPDRIVEGRDAISAVAGKLLEQFGPDFAFVPDAVAVGHHGMATLRWHAGPRQGPIAVTGTDLAEIQNGRIARLWVLLNPPPR
jgi:hypothetical protein